MDPARLPAALEASALVRRAQVAGGFAMIVHKGEADGGTILIVTVDNQGLGTLWERLPQLDGQRRWTAARVQDPASRQDFEDYLARRCRQDPDVWIVELTIADGERFILNGA